MSEEEKLEDKTSLARAHLPYRAEYCKTGRAKCKKCSEAMKVDSLKLANMTKSRFHEGYDANFYHVKCFFQIKRPKSVAEILHFETLKYDDQKMLEKGVETNGSSILGSVVEVETNGKSKKGKEAKGKTTKKGHKRDPTECESGGLLINYDDFMIEYAKSSRSKCNLCDEKIEKESIRLGKLDYDAETHWQGGPVPRWHHLECFAKSRERLEFYGRIDKIKGFEDLEKEDRKMLKMRIQPITTKSEIDSSKKIKIDESINPKEEELLREQSNRFFSLRDHINTMRRKDIECMLQSMGQKFNFKTSSLLVDHATDVLLFGPIDECPLCKQKGGFVLRGSSYICTRGTESEQCSYETREPKRDVPYVPKEITSRYSFFSDYHEFIGGQRIFPSKFIKAVEQKEAEDNNIVQIGAPLEGLSIGIISWKGVGIEKNKVEKKIITLGGKPQTALDKTLFIILSSEEELVKESPKVEVAKALDVPIARADFLFKVETKDDVVPELSKCLINEWNGDLEARFKKTIE